MATTPTTGTSLEVLAPYLPYGIEVETGIIDGLRERKQLHSLTQDGYPRTRLYGREEAASFEDMLPCLKPFSALCVPLPDGTVPAVEALRLALGWSADFYRNRFTARLAQAIPGEWYVRIESYSDYSGGWIRLGGDYGAWLFDGFDDPKQTVVDPCAAYDYLRSQHFAVGLEPHQFIAK